MTLILNPDLRYTEHRFGAGLILLLPPAYVLCARYLVLLLLLFHVPVKIHQPRGLVAG